MIGRDSPEIFCNAPIRGGRFHCVFVAYREAIRFTPFLTPDGNVAEIRTAQLQVIANRLRNGPDNDVSPEESIERGE